MKNLKRQLDSLEKALDEAEAAIPDSRQMVIVCCPLSEDKEGRGVGIHRHSNGLIDRIVYPDEPVVQPGDVGTENDGDDEDAEPARGYDALLDSVRSELGEPLTIIVIGPSVVPPPLNGDDIYK